MRAGSKLFLADLHLPLAGAFREVTPASPNYLVLGVLALYDPETLVQYLEGQGFRAMAVYYYPLSFLGVLEKVEG